MKRKASVGNEATSKKARTGNPFSVPPTAYHLGVFQAVEPFVDVWHTEGCTEARFKQKNKFYGGLMKEETLRYVGDLLADKLTKVQSIYTLQQSEGNIRPYHLALIEMFYCISAPSEQDFNELCKRFRRKNDANGLQALARLQREEVANDFEGFALEYQEKYVLDEESGEKAKDTGSSESSREGFYEAPPENELDVPEVIRTDIKLRIHKGKVLEDLKLSKRRKGTLKTQFCPYIAECKKEKDDRAIYQNAGYGRVEMRSNIASGHYDPMYLPVFAGQYYTYGILDVHAQLYMCDGEIDYDSYQESCGEKGVGPLDKSELIKRLQCGVMELELWPDLKSKRYPDGTYLVGDFYIESEWYALPSATDTMSHPDSLAFIEAMLRVVVGDKVLSWSPNDARRAYLRREEFTRLTRQAYGNPPADPLQYMSYMSDQELNTIVREHYQALGRLCREIKSR